MRFALKKIILLNLISIYSFVPLDVLDKEDLSFHHTRIIGGDTARVAQFPFVVAINASTPDTVNFCAGTILSTRWILTAAHCIQNATGIIISLGSNTLYQTDFNRILVSTSTYFLHPDFDPVTYDANVALLKLRSHVQFGEYVDSINLPVEPYLDNVTVTAVGWGQTSDEESGPVDLLSYVTLVTITNEECKTIYGEQYITDNIVCAVGQFSEGTCTGDSGGPLIYFLNNKHPIAIGVSSFHSGLGCEQPHPSGFGRVYSYLEWILETTNNLNDGTNIK